MSLSTDKMWINRISHTLDRFSWQREYLAACRCPICGDSQKSERKRRGYFYADHDQDCFRWTCHNEGCLAGWSLEYWLKKLHPELHREYIMERFEDSDKRDSVKRYVDVTGDFKKPEKAVPTKTKVIGKRDVKDPWLESLACIKGMNSDHFAKAYILGRKFPASVQHLLYYSDNFKATAELFGPEESDVLDRLPEDKRIIIPFFDGNGVPVAFQGRALEPNAPMRYITIKKTESTPKIYGRERIDKNRTRLCVEGPLDSLFLPNCYASADSNLLTVDADIYIPDFQFRNRDIVKRCEDIIEAGKKIVLVPPHILRKMNGKDINDLIIAGNSPLDIQRMIVNNMYSGLSAKLKLAELRRI